MIAGGAVSAARALRGSFLVASLLLALSLMTAGALAGGGSGSSPRIVGGKAAPEGAFPFTVALASPGEPARESTACGGALISPTTVITAAHCSGGEAASHEIVAGRNRLSDETLGERIPVEDIALHPEGIDIAQLRLSRPAGEAPITPATPEDADLFAPGRPGIAIGWGARRDGGEGTPDALRSVEIPFDSDATCADAYLPPDADDDFPFSAAAYICAGTRGRSSCFGDSGSPLIVTDPAGDPLLVGVTHGGADCGVSGTPAFYAEVPALLDFVTNPDPIFKPKPPASGPPATLEGRPRVGERLTCRHGDWIGERVRYGYIWMKIGGTSEKPTFKRIHRGEELTLKPRHQGSSVYCIVRAKTDGGGVGGETPSVKVRGRR